MNVRLERGPARDRAEALVRRGLEYVPPALPGLTPGTVRRWRGQATWQPPETAILARHRATGRPHWITGNRRDAPAGYALEFDIGLVQLHEQPGTRLLTERDGEYGLLDSAAAVPGGTRALGHVEQAAFPMMIALELRRVPETGQAVLVAGPADPLLPVTEPVAHLGFVEGYPIEPRRLVAPPLAPWNLIRLARLRDTEAWRHSYDAVPFDTDLDAVDGLSLGSLWTRPGPGLVELRRDAAGRVSSGPQAPAAAPGAGAPAAARWVAAPLGWSRPPGRWAVRAAVSRARHLAAPGPRDGAAAATTLGYVRTEPATGCSPLFSAVHPALPDQYLTRSTLEARDLGYRVEGIVGYVADVGAARAPGPREVLWGSRFGKRRRYVED